MALMKPILLLAALLALMCAAQNNTVNFTAVGSPYQQFTTIESTARDPAQFVRFYGASGLKLKIALPAKKNFSYTIMFQFRVSTSIEQMRADMDPHYLFEMADGPYCYFNSENLVCSPMMNTISLAKFNDLNSWLQFTFIGDHENNTSTLIISGLT